MKSVAISAPGEVTLRDLPMPEVGPWDALVRIEACALCGASDLPLIDRLRLADRPLPLLLGHDSVGTVLQVGERVRRYAVGQRVLRPSQVAPPEGYSTAWAGLSEYGLVTDDEAWREDHPDASPGHAIWPKQQVIPGEIPPAEATALVGLKETMSAVQNAGVDHTTWTAVIGNDWIARAMIYWAKARLAPFIVAFGEEEGLCLDMVELGANNYIAGDKPCSEDEAKLAGEGAFDRVLVAQQSMQAKLDALALARPDGLAGSYGALEDEDEDEPVQLLKARKAGRLRNLRIREQDVHDEVLAHVADGSLCLDRWISHRMPLREIQQAIELQRSGEALKVVVEL